MEKHHRLPTRGSSCAWRGSRNELEVRWAVPFTCGNSYTSFESLTAVPPLRENFYLIIACLSSLLLGTSEVTNCWTCWGFCDINQVGLTVTVLTLRGQIVSVLILTLSLVCPQIYGEFVELCSCLLSFGSPDQGCMLALDRSRVTSLHLFHKLCVPKSHTYHSQVPN